MGGSAVGCFCFCPVFSSVAIRFEISGTELKSIFAGILKQLCVLPGAQGPALIAVVADMVVMAMARAVEIQALI